MLATPDGNYKPYAQAKSVAFGKKNAVIFQKDRKPYRSNLEFYFHCKVKTTGFQPVSFSYAIFSND